MIDPAASLHADVAVVDEALEPFSAPQVNEYAGLRWMQRALEQRRAHIVAKIDEAEISTLTLRLRTADRSPAVRATTVATVLDALQRQLSAAADEVEWPTDIPDRRRAAALVCEVDTVTGTEGPASITVQRPSGPLQAHPPTADGQRLAFDAAVDVLLDALLAGGSGDLGALVSGEGLSIEITTSPATGEGRVVVLDPHTAPAARTVE